MILLSPAAVMPKHGRINTACDHINSKFRAGAFDKGYYDANDKNILTLTTAQPRDETWIIYDTGMREYCQ